MAEYPKDEVAGIFREVLGKSRRPVRLSTQARHAIDALTDVLGNEGIDAADRVAFEDARAALERYAAPEDGAPC